MMYNLRAISSAVLCGIIGDWGSGKTLFLVREAYKTYLNNKRSKIKKKIFANFHLRPPIKYEPLDLQKLIDQKVENAKVLLDEGYLYFPARRSMSESNIDIVNALQQIRHRDVSVFWSFQESKDTEKMIRQKATHYVICERRSWGFNYSVLRRQHVLGEGLDSELLPDFTIQVPYSHAQYLFKLYDHKEIISTVQIKKERQEYNEKKKAKKKAKKKMEEEIA